MRNERAAELTGMQDGQLSYGLEEITSEAGEILDENGRVLELPEWPLRRALKGEVVEGFMLMMNRSRRCIHAYPHKYSDDGIPHAIRLILEA